MTVQSGTDVEREYVAIITERQRLRIKLERLRADGEQIAREIVELDLQYAALRNRIDGHLLRHRIAQAS